jgi:virginiamycin B lyase
MARLGALGLVAAVLVLLGASATAAPTGSPSQSEVRLPRAWPQQLALGQDGSIWSTGAYGGLTRLDPSGHVRTYQIGQDEYGLDLASGPDGAVWVAADDLIVRVDTAGQRRSWRVGGYALARAITSAGGALWFANEGNPGRIERLGTDGSLATFKVTGPRKAAAMSGITGGPDGALWFTQAGFNGKPVDGIGRMTTDGKSVSWPLPNRHANPARITAGPDGALWFTERDAHAIGRIDTSGSIREYPLTTGLSPYEIAAGPDGALWFTADGCIGRITTSGAVSAWPVNGAGRLLGLVASPDGTIWAADDLKSALWHFQPPADGAPPPTPCVPPTITRHSRRTSASLVYRRDATFGHTDWFSDPRVRISRGGSQVFAETVPSIDRRYGTDVYGAAASFALRDLDGDRDPEVRLELNWGGAHCCAWTRVYRYVRSRATYVPAVHFWGDDAASPTVRDLNGDGEPEFRSVDARFAYEFASYAGSVFPIQIWSYRHGRFLDVTRRFPAAIRRDAAKLWRLYLQERRRKGEFVRGILPAWAADEYLLGRGATVWQTLEHEARLGYLDCRNGCFAEPRNPQAYIRKVRAFLRKTGYISRNR